jgi:hypothetical protein
MLDLIIVSLNSYYNLQYMLRPSDIFRNINPMAHFSLYRIFNQNELLFLFY